MSDLDTEQRPSRRLWFFAGVTALALHLGGAALALAHLPANEAAEDLGAAAIEVGVEMTAPRAEATDVPPGPDSAASAASPALAEQKAEPKDTELPKDTPAKSDDPDRAVTPDDTKRPVEKEAKVAAVSTSASKQSDTAEDAATPGSDTMPQGLRSFAPAPGTGDTARRLRAAWRRGLLAHLDKHKRYPANRAHKSAELLVSFVLDRMGHVLSTSVVKGSGDPAFDEAALAMIKHSDPMPPPPSAIPDEGLNFTLPVIFRAKGRS